MKFGQYELLEQIAVGGMSEVFKGRVVAAEGFEKLVAIKRILPDLAEDERFVKMLLTEARIHSALSHRNIVQIHDLGISESGEYFIVLEFVEGYDLRIIMEQIHGAGEIIPEALSLHIAAEIAQGLNFAHELRGPDGQPLGLIHRDVTPSNVLISFAGEVKLSDFGLAKRRHDRSVVGSLKGNLAYMSPEQANQAQLDRRTDIFSLGAILFELLTGKRLREITDEVAGWSQVASGVVPSARKMRPDLPAAVEHLLDRALASDPAKRFPDAATFGAEIRNVLADLSVAVGSSDLAALLGVINPPRRPRALLTERSKVIRLGPEAEALKEAFAAPATPAPVAIAPPGRIVKVADPGPTPPAQRNFTPARTPARSITPALTAAPRSVTPAQTAAQRSRTPPAKSTPGANNAKSTLTGRPDAADPNLTPPPSAPLPPARARGYTPFTPTRDPDLTPRATPPAHAVPPARPAPRNPPPSARQTPAAPTSARQTPAAPTSARQTPAAPMNARQTPAAPMNARQTPAAPQPAARGPAPGPAQGRPSQPGQAFAPSHAQQPGRATRPTGPRPAVLPETPAYGVQRPPPQDFALAKTLHAPMPMGRAMDDPNRGIRETARVQLRSRPQWGSIFAVVLLLLAAAGAGVHLWVIPLDVLITWNQPTGLAIKTDPVGATVRLDGAPLASTAPMTVSVYRDRNEHVLEASRAGYRTSRQKIRYDKAASLSATIFLERDPNAEPAAAPAAAPQKD
jgi:serine/threonine protein kinase